MSKLYTLTEDNYKEVVKRLQKYCNKWRFLRRYTTYKVSERNKKDSYPDSAISFQSKSWGYRRRFVMQKGNLVPTIETVFIENDSFIVPKEHNFKIHHDNNSFGYYDMWKDCKPLIHITTGSSTAIVLTYGDTILFTKYGFTICTDDNYIRFNEPYLLVYKDEFIIHKPDGRILDYDEEISTLQKDIGFWDSAIRDMEDDDYYDYYDYDDEDDYDE